MNEAQPIPKSLSKRGIQCVEDNVVDEQSIDCGLLIFSHFEKEFREQFIDRAKEESE